MFYYEELAIPGQTATGKESSNPFMAGSLPKTIHFCDSLQSDEDSFKLIELMILCTNFLTMVLDLENTKTSQQSEIASLKRSSLGDDASKQGRIDIGDINTDAEITLIDETQGRINDIIADEDITLIPKLIIKLLKMVHPYPFNYPTMRLTMKEILAEFIDEGKHEHEEMEIFIKEFRTTNELLLKERSCNTPKNGSQWNMFPGALFHNTIAQVMRERPLTVSFEKKS
ncbi:hypothetical protein Tco_1568029 [Tanacetum coccineum]